MFISLPSILFPGSSFAILFERMKVSKSPDRWRVKKIIGSGVAFGSYLVLSTIIFFRAVTLPNFLSVSSFSSD
jgi:hypothetical protein